MYNKDVFLRKSPSLNRDGWDNLAQMLVELRLKKSCRSLTQGSAPKPGTWPWWLIDQAGAVLVNKSSLFDWDCCLNGLCRDSQTPIVCAQICRCPWRPQAGSLETELQAVVSCSTWVLETKLCRENLLCTVWKHHLSIKIWRPISKRQEVGGSSGWEIGTLGDSQRWEIHPRLWGNWTNEMEERWKTE